MELKELLEHYMGCREVLRPGQNPVVVLNADDFDSICQRADEQAAQLSAANAAKEQAERERDALLAYREMAERSLGVYADALNWGIFGHQAEAWTMLDFAVKELVAKRDDNARLRERVDELEGVFSKLSGGVDMKGRSPVVMPVKDFLAQMDAPKGGEA